MRNGRLQGDEETGGGPGTVVTLELPGRHTGNGRS